MLRWYQKNDECVEDGVLSAIDTQGSSKWEREWERSMGSGICPRIGIRAYTRKREKGVSYTELREGSGCGMPSSIPFWFQI